ncbi:carbohydrate ABC transporter substrate-binding protein, CUT1 family [Clostridium sp. USBA 49]|uniref:ABC transporter substrate-binding protein n=1 Tax=Clostridium sp. USBA 49 TaxID=1881060 RepID=UPI0009CB7951|nr:ABC transporter substrate-binding protein [Clostridium sp. USBA 49]SKA85304.1 carbohydrate ABC transporter substrate-binding protein, CUT1 family [Clostridium sp. USBA 49]
MKTKQLMSIILSTIVITGILSGCSKKASEQTGANVKGNNSSTPVTIKLWHHWGSEQRKPTIDGMLSEFNKKYADKNIKVEGTFVPFGDMDKKITASIAAGNPPDVAVQPIEAVAVMASRNQLEDITSYMPKNIESKYYDNLWDTVTYKGKIYALPFNTDTRLLFYNKKMFKEAGINEFPKTWDEFFSIADKLDKKDGNKYTTLTFHPMIGNFGFDTIALSNGGRTVNDFMNPTKPTANLPQNVEALEWMLKWRERYGTDTWNSFMQQGSGANDPFISEKVAIYGNVCNYIATLKKYAPNMEYGVAPMPVGPSGTTTGSIGGGFVIVVPKGSKHVKEASEYVKFMTDDWATTKWALEQADVMINKNANENEKLKENPAWQTVIDNMKYTNVIRRIPTAPNANGAMSTAIDNVLKASTQKPKEALDKAQLEIEKMIKDNEALTN